MINVKRVFFPNSELYDYSLKYERIGSPANYLKNFPLYHSQGVTTPTLFLMGNSEFGGVDAEGTTQYNAIKAQDVETEYVKHVFEKTENRRDFLA